MWLDLHDPDRAAAALAAAVAEPPSPLPTGSHLHSRAHMWEKARIARPRTEMRSGGEEGLLNKLLNEMDELTADAEILFVLTTNRPEALETALASRPGRIDRAIEFPLPDPAGRLKLVRLYAAGVPAAVARVPRTSTTSDARRGELSRLHTILNPSSRVREESHMPKQYFNPPALNPTSGFTHVVAATGGKTVYVSGQVSVDRNAEVVGRGDMRAQVERTFENLAAALAAAGATFRDVVKITYFVVGLKPEHVAHVREVRGKYLDPVNPPASSLVGVAALVVPDWLIEIELVAVVGE